MLQVVVPNEIRQQVAHKILEGINKLKAHYGVNVSLPLPRVSYELSGTTAGRANFNTWEIKINGALLMLHQREMIETTVPHELAHLAVDRIYPEAHRGRGFTLTGSGRYKRAKREVHGPRFKEIMAVLGADDSRCHSLDTSLVARKKASYTYECEACSKTYELGPKRHAKLVAKPRVYWCRCYAKGTLKLIDKKPAQAPAIRQIILPQVQTVQTTAAAPKPVVVTHIQGSKWDVCVDLFRKHRNLSRQTIIGLFVSEAHCTPAGAATYYAKCKSTGV